MRRLVFVLPIVVFLALTAYFARSLFSGFSGLDPTLVASPLIDQPAPTFTLPPLPGHEHGLDTADLKGQVQIVNIFASWCPPCRAEAPVLMALARDHHIAIRGIAYKDKPEDTLAYLAQLGDPYKSIGADNDGRTAIDWGAYRMPETYIVDAEGRIRYRVSTPLTPENVRRDVLPMLATLGVK
jgi:cytochrome c biogenesis protein CcmG/thiol:disulfide interchange protein DsbE